MNLMPIATPGSGLMGLGVSQEGGEEDEEAVERRGRDRTSPRQVLSGCKKQKPSSVLLLAGSRLVSLFHPGNVVNDGEIGEGATGRWFAGGVSANLGHACKRCGRVPASPRASEADTEAVQVVGKLKNVEKVRFQAVTRSRVPTGVCPGSDQSRSTFIWRHPKSPSTLRFFLIARLLSPYPASFASGVRASLTSRIGTHRTISLAPEASPPFVRLPRLANSLGTNPLPLRGVPDPVSALGLLSFPIPDRPGARWLGRGRRGDWESGLSVSGRDWDGVGGDLPSWDRGARDSNDTLGLCLGISPCLLRDKGGARRKVCGLP